MAQSSAPEMGPQPACLFFQNGKCTSMETAGRILRRLKETGVIGSSLSAVEHRATTPPSMSALSIGAGRICRRALGESGRCDLFQERIMPPQSDQPDSEEGPISIPVNKST